VVSGDKQNMALFLAKAPVSYSHPIPTKRYRNSGRNLTANDVTKKRGRAYTVRSNCRHGVK
jgi:hypothetical protein